MFSGMNCPQQLQAEDQWLCRQNMYKYSVDPITGQVRSRAVVKLLIPRRRMWGSRVAQQQVVNTVAGTTNPGPQSTVKHL